MLTDVSSTPQQMRNDTMSVFLDLHLHNALVKDQTSARRTD